MPEAKFEAEALERFLQAVDSELDASAQIVVIGGAAISLVYAPRYGTDDIDTLSFIERILGEKTADEVEASLNEAR